MNNTRNKYLLKNTLLFSIGNFGSKIISFFLVPLYTNVLTTSQYGTIDLMTILTTVIAPIITLNISEAVMRFLMDKNGNEKDVLNITLIICLLSAMVSIVCIPIFNLFSATSDYSVILSLYLFSFSISNIMMCYIRGVEKIASYSVINIIQTLIIVILNVLFLVKFNLGIFGYILAYTIAFTITSILCVIFCNIFKEFKIKKINIILFKSMSKYSLLLIPNALMWWIMNSLDRVMVSSMINIDANGIYAVSYKIPTILMTITSVFNQAWMFSVVKEKESKDKNEYTNSVFKYLNFIVIITASLLIIVLKPLMAIYVGKDFYESWKYVPPLLVGTTFLTLGTFLSNEYTANKDSAGFLKSSTIGAIINLILNFILISFFGVIGAAISTCISYLTVFVFRIYDTKKYVKINYRDKKYLINFILMILISIIVYSNNLVSYVLMCIIYALLIINNYEYIKKIFLKVLKKKTMEVKYEKSN